MLRPSFKPAKCKTALKLATSRIKLMKNKKENHLKQLKRELAQLLESGQDQTARIRVEHVVREEKTIAAYELIDLYCELIVARLPIIDSQKNCPIDLKEAVTTVVFAAPRCADIPELQDVRKQFTAKYGKEFINAALELRPDCGVSRMLVEKLSANAPDGQTKLKILSAIAEEHNIEWDPKKFGEKESKPYDDLLKGPSTFDNASKMEPPITQAPPPNVHVPQGREEKHDAPVNYQQNLNSSSPNNFSSSDFSGGQSTPSTDPHPPLRPSGSEYGVTETRHSHSRDENDFSSGGKKWKMEFKDATEAAQAAAESAERASTAARAAAQLAMSQHSHESYNSNTERRKKHHDSPSENYNKNAEKNSPQDRNRNPSMQTEQEDGYLPESHYDANERFYNDDQISAKRYSQTASVSVDDKRPVNNFHEVNKYSRKSSFGEEEVKPPNETSLSGTGVSKQSSGEDQNTFSDSSSIDGDDYLNSYSHQNFVFDDKKDPFDDEKSHRENVETGDNNTAEAIFDSYLSDHDIIKFDKQPQYDEVESNSHDVSITREPSDNFAVNIEKESSWENTSGSSEKPISTSFVSDEFFSAPQFDEISPKAPKSVNKDDITPVVFDESSGPSSESENEVEKSSFRGKSDGSPRSYKENELFRISDDINDDHGLKGSYFTEKNDMGFTPIDESRSEKDKEMIFPQLIGGLRNKMYKTPPYKKSSSGDLLSPKKAAEDTPTYTHNTPDSPRVESSSLDSTVSPKLKESLNSKTHFKNNYLGTDDNEEELPRQSLQSKREEYVEKEKSGLKSRIKYHDSGMDDFEENISKSKLENKQERKEYYAKSKFSAPAGFFASDGDDSEEDLPKQTVPSKIRAGSGFSRRTKANANPETSSYSKTKPISVTENKHDVSENRPKPRSQFGKNSDIRPVPDEKSKSSASEQISSPLKIATSSGEAPSRESSLNKASHVHPKLPDYDSIAAHLQSLRQN